MTPVAWAYLGFTFWVAGELWRETEWPQRPVTAFLMLAALLCLLVAFLTQRGWL